jgi:hypothetical protein
VFRRHLHSQGFRVGALFLNSFFRQKQVEGDDPDEIRQKRNEEVCALSKVDRHVRWSGGRVAATASDNIILNNKQRRRPTSTKSIQRRKCAAGFWRESPDSSSRFPVRVSYHHLCCRCVVSRRSRVSASCWSPSSSRRSAENSRDLVRAPSKSAAETRDKDEWGDAARYLITAPRRCCDMSVR